MKTVTSADKTSIAYEQLGDGPQVKPDAWQSK
jgi:hypothetical protein